MRRFRKKKALRTAPVEERTQTYVVRVVVMADSLSQFPCFSFALFHSLCVVELLLTMFRPSRLLAAEAAAAETLA